MELLLPADEIPKGLPLIIALQGFSDAGNVVSQMQDYFKNLSEAETVYEFDSDRYLDYRARRPSISFKNDHLHSFEIPSLRLDLKKDSVGAPFLLLTGYEPDFKWKQFVASVEYFVVNFEVSETVWVHAIPMPVPHTRPIGTTVSGNREDLIEKKSAWRPETRLSASIGHVIEHSLFTKEHTVVGFVLLVSHYLANTDYPHALEVALESVMDATGLLLASDDREEIKEQFLKQVNEQIDASEESKEMVRGLEARYDDYMSNLETNGTEFKYGDIPSGDELASDFQRFLAERDTDETPEGFTEE